MPSSSRRASCAGEQPVGLAIAFARQADPLWRSAVEDWHDVVLVVAGLFILAGLRVPPWLLVPLMALAGRALSAG